MSDSGEFHIAPEYVQLLRDVGLGSAESVFNDSRIKIWRSLPDRENAMLDHVSTDGSKVRLHVKRYPRVARLMAERELAGFKLLVDAGIPSAPIIAHGMRGDGSTFIVLKDLTGYTPADKLLAAGFPFHRLLEATAALAALLHNQKLHHRDLYLCHFMIKPGEASVDAKLIDMARVNRMDNFITRRRWIVKDLAQFWFSTLSVAVTDEQRERWLDRYCQMRGISTSKLLYSVRQKSSAIGRHDAKLKQQQPLRNVSIGDQTNQL